MPNLLGSAVDQASLLHLGTYTVGGLPLQFPAEVTNDAQMQSYFQQWRPDAPPRAAAALFEPQYRSTRLPHRDRDEQKLYRSGPR